MKPRITVITLAVDDLERSITFYRDGLGLATEGIIGTEFEYGAVAFFELQAGIRLAVWPRKSLAHDTPGFQSARRALPSFPLAITWLPKRKSMRLWNRLSAQGQ